MFFWQHFLARLSKVNSAFPQDYFQSLYFCMKAQNPILSFGMNQNVSFPARRLSARLPKLHFSYVEENFQEDEINWSKLKFTIDFKNWANFFSQCCHNCIVHVQTDILRNMKSFEKVKFAIKFKSWGRTFFGIEFKTAY